MPPDSAPSHKPLIIADLEGRQHTVLAVNAAAARDGLSPGMALAHARAVQPHLHVLPAQPVDDARALERLAVWCLRYSPLTAPCPPDSVWIDATGATHLFGGEEAMLEAIRTAFTTHGLSIRVAMAHTPGAAWALARYGASPLHVSRAPADLNPLPIPALRLNVVTARALWRVGLKTIADLRQIPRATLPRRFGRDVLLRLDQALGHAPEAIDAMLPPQAYRTSRTFAEPIATPGNLEQAALSLAENVCADLERRQDGARKFDLVFFRTDNRTQIIRLSLARASHNPRHIGRLLVDKIATVDPGFGVERVTLTAWRTESLLPRQIDHDDACADAASDVNDLVDSLINQLGAHNVYRVNAFATDIPERAETRITPAKPAMGAWPVNLPRPIRLLYPPEPVDVTALLPDHPPARFAWRGTLRKIKHADGPERIYGEWWHDPRECTEVRDYFRVEDEDGARFWLFRDNRMDVNNRYRWYLHGLFA